MDYYGYCPSCKKDDAYFFLLHRPLPRKGARCEECKAEINRLRTRVWYQKKKCVKK